MYELRETSWLVGERLRKRPMVELGCSPQARVLTSHVILHVMIGPWHEPLAAPARIVTRLEPSSSAPCEWDDRPVFWWIASESVQFLSYPLQR